MPIPPDQPLRGGHWELPPLVLHPFASSLESDAALNSIQLSLYSAGFSDRTLTEDELYKLLRCRYSEFRMLYYVGKDLLRWIRQCVDFAVRDDQLATSGMREQSFSDLLVNRTPSDVAGRFLNWGVNDYRRLLSRAIGLNTPFASVPEFALLSPDFLENYYSYADALFTCYQQMSSFSPLDSQHFHFSLYTSDEYLRAVEREAAT